MLTFRCLPWGGDFHIKWCTAVEHRTLQESLMVHDTSQAAAAASHVRAVESIMAHQEGWIPSGNVWMSLVMVGVINQPRLPHRITGNACSASLHAKPVGMELQQPHLCWANKFGSSKISSVFFFHSSSWQYGCASSHRHTLRNWKYAVSIANDVQVPDKSCWCLPWGNYLTSYFVALQLIAVIIDFWLHSEEKKKRWVKGGERRDEQLANFTLVMKKMGRK